MFDHSGRKTLHLGPIYSSNCARVLHARGRSPAEPLPQLLENEACWFLAFAPERMTAERSSEENDVHQVRVTITVTEDDPLLALEIQVAVEDASAEVVGPVGSSDLALEFLKSVVVAGVLEASLADGNVTPEWRISPRDDGGKEPEQDGRRPARIRWIPKFKARTKPSGDSMMTQISGVAATLW
jgi:hypothetical protein